jgi:hypothetical protein
MPHSSSISAISSDVSGVTWDGLSTAAFPAANAGMQSPKELVRGKFHGPITPTTPSGW